MHCSSQPCGRNHSPKGHYVASTAHVMPSESQQVLTECPNTGLSASCVSPRVLTETLKRGVGGGHPTYRWKSGADKSLRVLPHTAGPSTMTNVGSAPLSPCPNSQLGAARAGESRERRGEQKEGVKELCVLSQKRSSTKELAPPRERHTEYVRQ